MVETLVDALLPSIVTVSLGFAAGMHKDFTAEQSLVLNRMVMLYALPMAVFAGLMGMSREALFANLPLLFWLFLALVGGYFAVFGISRYLFRRSRGAAALQALAIASPAVSFVGISVLETLYGDHCTLTIAVCGFLMNLIQIPFTLIMLASDTQDEAVQSTGNWVTLWKSNLRHAVKEPVVWLPLTGFLFVLAGFHVSAPIRDSVAMLGSVTGGVALFSSGIILNAQKIHLDLPAAVNVLAKNFVFPAMIGLGMLVAGTEASIRSVSVIALAIPTGSTVIILAVHYGIVEREMATSMFLSTFLSLFSMAVFILWIG